MKKTKNTFGIMLVMNILIGMGYLLSATPGYSQTRGYLNGHEWVDLGLSSGLKWATCNVGASSPDQYGDYYAWGELDTKDEYSEDNCSTSGKYFDTNISGNPDFDVARAKWGGSWRMPEDDEIQELIDKCSWKRMTQGTHRGFKITGPNGNSIFLPAAGCRSGAELCVVETYGCYWSATPGEGLTEDAYVLNFPADIRYVTWVQRYYGRTIRPVSN